MKLTFNKAEIKKMIIPTASSKVLHKFSRRIFGHSNLEDKKAASCGVLNPNWNKKGGLLSIIGGIVVIIIVVTLFFRFF